MTNVFILFYLYSVKLSASSEWSLHPKSAWDRVKTQPTLLFSYSIMNNLPPLVATVPTNHLPSDYSTVLTFGALVIRSFYQNHHSIQILLRSEAIRSSLLVPLIWLLVADLTLLVAGRSLELQLLLELLLVVPLLVVLRGTTFHSVPQVVTSEVNCVSGPQSFLLVPLEEGSILKIILKLLLKVYTV